MNQIDHSEQDIPLCVDLDGTLLRTDTLHELMLILLKQKPYLLCRLPFWLFRGKAYTKHAISDVVELDPTLLPLNTGFVKYIQQERDRGRKIVLVTAANQKLADSIAQHLGLFDEVLGSNHQENLSGKRKDAHLLKKYGKKKFDYAGNSRADLSVWPNARHALAVHPSWRTRRQLKKMDNVQKLFEERAPLLPSILRSMRIHQWLKNILIFIPIIASHSLTNISAITSAAHAFLAFCFCCSATYLFNDLLDLQADRSHPRKRKRPTASGDLPIVTAGLLALLLLFIGIGIALTLPIWFQIILIAYIVVTSTYSLILKQLPIVDVITLAGLYTLRIIAGHAATGIAYSEWLLAFAVFFFLSLALVKRVAELILREGSPTIGRGYQSEDIDMLTHFGTVSGYLSVLILALYINSDKVTKFYSHPWILWFTLPLLLFWISRIWLQTHRGDVHDDLPIYALCDVPSYLTAILFAAVLFTAT